MFNDYPIFKRVLSNQITSKINIVLLLIFLPVFTGLIFLGIISANLTIFGWLAFATLLLYVTFYNIFFIVSFFNRDLELGVTNLEIRSGYKKGNVYFQRLIAQKAYILPVQILLFLLWFLLGYFSGVPFIKMSSIQLSYGMLTIFIYEILVSSFLLLFSSFKNGISTTFFGVIFGILLSVMPLFSLLDAHTNSLVATTDKDYGKYSLQKYSVLDEMDKIRHNNKNGIIDGQVSIHFPNEGENVEPSKTSHFFEIFTVFDDFFKSDDVRGIDENSSRIIKNVKQNYFSNGRDYYSSEDNAITMSRSYANDLIYNGLVVEFINPVLPIYSEGKEQYFSKFINDSKNNETNNSELTPFERYEYLIETNNVLKFINQINEIDKKFKLSVEEEYENSFFQLDAKANKRFSGPLGFDNFTAFLKKQDSTNSELNAIIDLVNETAKYSYTSSYKTNGSRSSIFDISGSISDDYTLYAEDTNLWLTTDANNDEKEWLDISSDGARVFFKVYFDILREYMVNNNPEYILGNINSEKEIVDGGIYLREIKKKTLLNPGIMLTRLFYNAGNNRNFNNSQNEFFDPFITYVYDFDDSIKDSKRIEEYLDLNKNPNGSNVDDYLLWDIDENPIDAKFIETLKKVILKDENGDVTPADIDFSYVRKNNYFNGESIGGIKAYSINSEFYGEKNFSIQFVKEDGEILKNEKDIVIAAIDKEVEKDSSKALGEEKLTKADLYKFGKNDGQLQYIGSTFNVWIPLAILVISSGILLELSWVIFNRRIIK